jgi:hypothetical protein
VLSLEGVRGEMSKRGYYLGGHSLVYGSASKYEAEEFWSEAKARADAVHSRGLTKEREIRERIAAREAILDGSVHIREAGKLVSQILADIELLKVEASNAGVRFSPGDGIGRTLILVSGMLDMIGYISDHEDEDSIMAWSDLL